MKFGRSKRSFEIFEKKTQRCNARHHHEVHVGTSRQQTPLSGTVQIPKVDIHSLSKRVGGIYVHFHLLNAEQNESMTRLPSTTLQDDQRRDMRLVILLGSTPVSRGRTPGCICFMKSTALCGERGNALNLHPSLRVARGFAVRSEEGRRTAALASNRYPSGSTKK